MRRNWVGRGEGVNLVKLKDLEGYIERKVSLIGLIVEFSLPHPSRGTDFVETLKIVDQLQHDKEICVNMFAPTVDHLPHVRSSKDIVLLSGVQIKRHHECPAVVFNARSSAFALFDGKDEANVTPYQASPAFGQLDAYNNSIRQFRYWCRNFPFDAGMSNYTVPIEDMREGFFDIVCKILHAGEIAADNWVLFVWDGTDAPALNLKSKLGEENDQVALCIEPKPLPVDVVSGFPCVGTVLRVIAADAYGYFRDHFSSIGSWARIRNMWLKQHVSGLWMGTFTEKTKIRLLSENDNSVKERIRIYEERIEESRWPSSSRCTSDFLTVTNHKDISYATLMDLLTLSQNHGRFKCIVRVVSVFPSQATEFVSYLHHRDPIVMTLEDPTARIRAMICSHDAEVLFEGYLALDVLTLKMNKLIGVAEEGPMRNPPWTEVCLELHPPMEDDASGQKMFHICDTTFAQHSH